MSNISIPSDQSDLGLIQFRLRDGDATHKQFYFMIKLGRARASLGICCCLLLIYLVVVTGRLKLWDELKVRKCDAIC